MGVLTFDCKKAEVRFLEQKIMDHYGGPLSVDKTTKLLNKVRSYTDENPNSKKYRIAGVSVEYADKLFKTTLKKIEELRNK